MHHSAHQDHAHHDVSLIAGHAAGDLSDFDTVAAAALLSSCTSCTEIHRDLVAIASATRALPRTAHAPRDFRLSPEQAEHLQRGSWLRTLLRPFASARSATRPMAAAFTSVGLAGVLVAVVVPSLIGGLGGAASAPSRDSATFGPMAGGPASTQAPAAPAADSAAPEAAGATFRVQAAAGGGSSDDANIVQNGGDSGMEVAVGGQSTDNGLGELSGAQNYDGGERPADTSPVNLLFIGSLALLAVGIALFGLRFAARRLR
jgi:hypothetical protein